MAERREIPRNPKRWNDGKSPEILKDGMIQIRKSPNIPREGTVNTVKQTLGIHAKIFQCQNCII